MTPRTSLDDVDDYAGWLWELRCLTLRTTLVNSEDYAGWLWGLRWLTLRTTLDDADDYVCWLWGLCWLALMTTLVDWELRRLTLTTMQDDAKDDGAQTHSFKTLFFMESLPPLAIERFKVRATNSSDVWNFKWPSLAIWNTCRLL